MMHTKLYALRHGDRSFDFLGFDDFLGRRLTSGAFYEQGMLDYISRLDVPGTYLDVGAFVGTHTVFFSELCPACTRVLAFEPVLDSYMVLSENIRNNCVRAPTTARMAAVGDRCGTCAMAAGPADNAGMSHVVDVASGKTELITIDAVVAKGVILDVGLIKIDVEDHEEEVLAGAGGTIRAQRPHLFVEIKDRMRLKAISTMLGKLAYKRVAVFNKTPTYHFAP